MSASRMRSTAIGRAHGGDLEAIKEEIRTSTQQELSERYCVSIGTVTGWTGALKVYCTKICVRCRQRRRAEEMSPSLTGFASLICSSCVTPSDLAHRAKQRERKRRQGEFLRRGPVGSPDPAIRALSVRMSSESGYWNRWAQQ